MMIRTRSMVGAVAVLGAALLAGCPGPEYPKCEKDDHCKDKGEVCVFGQCQQCAKDQDCKDGKVCRSYRCVPRPECERDLDCKGNQVCRAGACKLECNTDADCGQGRSCQKNRCVTRTECAEDADCPSDQSCVGGLCRPRSGEGDEGQGECSIAPRVHFDFNESSITAEARGVLDANAACLKSKPQLQITIEGHCDDRGTVEYNLALGERRAAAVRKYLQSLGVDNKRLKIISYGEEKPLSTAATEEGWAQNRRAEFKLR